MRQHKILLAGLVLLSPLPVLADRKPVLQQIQLPHNYYYREMYLPQLTTGPSALTFSPDGKEVVYGMGGSLWRQTIGSDQTQELTHAGGYDYQPDCPMMADTLYSPVTRTTLSSCGSSTCKLARKPRSPRTAMSMSSRDIRRMTATSHSFPPLTAVISTSTSQRWLAIT